MYYEFDNSFSYIQLEFTRHTLLALGFGVL